MPRLSVPASCRAHRAQTTLYAAGVQGIVASVEPTDSRPQHDLDADAHHFALKLHALGPRPNPWRSPTNVIIALNVAVYAVMGALGAGWIQPESMMPYILYGANNGAATTDGQWWRLLTSMFYALRPAASRAEHVGSVPDRPFHGTRARPGGVYAYVCGEWHRWWFREHFLVRRQNLERRRLGRVRQVRHLRRYSRLHAARTPRSCPAPWCNRSPAAR